MNRIVLGAFLALLLAGIGMFWLQGQAAVEREAPPPEPMPAAADAADPAAQPSADVAGLRGPAPPQASQLTREQQRFFRYDRDRDLSITRSEMLSSRTAAFRKLDVDGNNLLTFEEWAVATVKRFDGADANRDGELNQPEFAATAPRPASTPRCRC